MPYTIAKYAGAASSAPTNNDTRAISSVPPEFEIVSAIPSPDSTRHHISDAGLIDASAGPAYCIPLPALYPHSPTTSDTIPAIATVATTDDSVPLLLSDQFSPII